MTQRLSYKDVAPDAYRALLGVETHLRKSGLDPRLLDLVYLRVSQINGCAFCVDMHSKDLHAAGESAQRIDLLPVFREAPVYSDRERAALAWAEAVTRLRDGDVPDDVYADARRAFEEKELVELTLAVAAINAWNRLGVAFRSTPGAYQPKTR